MPVCCIPLPYPVAAAGIVISCRLGLAKLFATVWTTLLPRASVDPPVVVLSVTFNPALAAAHNHRMGGTRLWRNMRGTLRCRLSPLPASLFCIAMNGYLLLALAIVAEVIATSSLKASQGFTRLLPSVLVVTGYVAAFYLLMLVMRTVPVGIAYAIWSGAGIVLVSLIAVVLYRQVPDLAACVGIGLIIAGVAVIQLFSKTSAH